MPKFYPSYLHEGTPGSERRVWQALEALDDDWRVFHSVAWQSMRAGREGDGEADFVLLHPRYGLIVLEVKGGELTIDAGQWHSRNRFTGEVNRIKNPFEQAKISKYALLKHLDEIFPPRFGGTICHGAALPDVTVDRFLGLDAPRDITLDASDLIDMPASISRLLKHWGASSTIDLAQMKAITALLAPTTSMKTGLKARIAGALFEQIHLTERQVQALSQLKRVRRALTLGPAGSGKTVLAVERARQLLRDGFDVLLTCFNRPLSERLASEFPATDVVTIRPFHALCVREMRQAGVSMPSDPSSEWWDAEAASCLLESAERTKTRFGAIVVDEGQDFPREWLDALILMLRDPDEDPFYVFADTLQAIYHRKWSIPKSWPVIELDLNCRSTIQIVEKIARLFDSPVASLGAEGPHPLFVRARSQDEARQVIPQLVNDLLTAESLEPDQLAVLTGSTTLARHLRDTTAGEHSFVEIGKKGVVAETIHRFKGLEAEVVILSLVGLDLDRDEHRSVAYVGMSRARAMLFVLGGKETQAALHWGS